MDPYAGNSLVKILLNQPGHLIAQQFMPDRSIQGSAITLVLMVIAAIGLAIYFYRIRYWRGQLLPLILLAMVGSWLHQGPAKSWRMELKQQTGTINYETYADDKLLTHNEVALQDVTSAEMQFDRGDTRIVLILKDGTQVLPLGKITVQNAPNHYVILTAIRSAIGQIPAPASSP